MEAVEIGRLFGILFRWVVGIYFGYQFSQWFINKFSKKKDGDINGLEK